MNKKHKPIIEDTENIGGDHAWQDIPSDVDSKANPNDIVVVWDEDSHQFIQTTLENAINILKKHHRKSSKDRRKC